MQAAALILLAVAIGSEVNAQSFYGSVGQTSCPAYAMYGTQTTSSTNSVWNVGSSSSVSLCQYCVQGSVSGSSSQTIGGTATSTTYTGTAYFCVQSCPSSTATITYSQSSALLTTTGINLSPIATYYATVLYAVPTYTTNTFTGTFTITNMNCYKAAAWKSSASPALLLALIAVAFIARKN